VSTPQFFCQSSLDFLHYNIFYIIVVLFDPSGSDGKAETAGYVPIRLVPML
jgi:hypothetical protein